jgi:hypothetical protein
MSAKMKPLRSEWPLRAEYAEASVNNLYAMSFPRHRLQREADVNVRLRHTRAICVERDVKLNAKRDVRIRRARPRVPEPRCEWSWNPRARIPAPFFRARSVADDHGAGHGLGSFQFRCG